MKPQFVSLVLLAAAVVTASSCAGTGASVGAAKPYPLSTCIVTDNELGSMGEVVTKVYDGREVKFCCKPCVKKFEANPSKYLTKLP